ncbi:precorrin-2 dehydrogenase/sirohydrochlorin ferrochelatase family protein [Novisyntrophococcus fermenticellae]|uniref:precorrin-2 dehydrogenase/sirohydrochlorin ferrochelatase family protein n=1 Tax=Novisyntrophococcus fermenticellae TaxID=2068655 RepID=UPI001E65BCEC|nr:bifunctional precorrin-2 dehydrogenase/sirohydrochlorin ferrochelatase [Novisyntrophococcus fermenticellae]
MMNKHGYFPLFLDISDKRILVVGAGAIALRRIKTLLLFTDKIEVAAKAIHPEITMLSEAHRLQFVGNRYEDGMLEGVFMVLACTDDRELNSRICSRAHEQGILANNCSSREACDFFFPSVIRQEELVIGINAGGNDHKKVKETRKKIEQIMGGNDADYNRNQGEPSGTDTK